MTPRRAAESRRRARRGGREESGSAIGQIRAVIARIPRGRVISYGEVAAVVGIPRGARLTVWALHQRGRIPWHRVVAAGGRIALSGDQAREQRRRLRAEGVRFRGDRVIMELHRWTPRPRPARRRATRSRSTRRPDVRPARAEAD